MKNYTSSVSSDQTVSRIERALARSGASNILKDYEGGEVSAISFSLLNPATGKKMMVRLPANIAAVEKVLIAQVKRPRKETIKRIKAQAARTAWKIQQDWVEVQLSLIELEQVEALQVFLPYIWDGRKTFYAALKENNFRLLTAGKAHEEGS
jgi:hypothetical protein